MFPKLVFITEGQNFLYVGFEFYIGGTALDCFFYFFHMITIFYFTEKLVDQNIYLKIFCYNFFLRFENFLKLQNIRCSKKINILHKETHKNLIPHIYNKCNK